MAKVIEQKITEKYALYCGDSCEVLQGMPSESVHLSLYSPPFATGSGALYRYSSNERDISNSKTYQGFLDHYEFVVRELLRVSLPGRCSAVHCMDIPGAGANLGGDAWDLPGDIIRLHKKVGWHFSCRYHVWKEPLGVRNQTMAKGLAHKQIVDDSTLCDNAAADQLVMFRKPGKNTEPVTHPRGLSFYAGSRPIPQGLTRNRGFQGKQTQNTYSHWIWRQYASAFWDDVRITRVLPYEKAKEHEDEPHMHPLQLDVIERAVVLWTNPGDTVLSPFAGVGSEVYGALVNGRKGIGIELKKSYYNQMVRNVRDAKEHGRGNLNEPVQSLLPEWE